MDKILESYDYTRSEIRNASDDVLALSLSFLLADIARAKREHKEVHLQNQHYVQQRLNLINHCEDLIKKMKKHLGKKKFAEIEKLAKTLNTKRKKTEEREDYWTGKVVSGFFIFIAILIFWWMFLAEREECETVTWTEYGKKKTGQICGEARDQMNVIRDQKGIYKKGNDGLPEE